MKPLTGIGSALVVMGLVACTAGDSSPLSRVPIISQTAFDSASQTTYSDENSEGRIDRIRIATKGGPMLDYLDTDFDGRWDLVRESKGPRSSSRQPTDGDLQQVEEALIRFLKNSFSSRDVEAVAVNPLSDLQPNHP